MSDYDWIIGIAMPIALSLIFFLLDKHQTGLVIFAFLNIFFGIMVYSGLLEVWVMILNLIATVFFIFLTKSGSGFNE